MDLSEISTSDLWDEICQRSHCAVLAMLVPDGGGTTAVTYLHGDHRVTVNGLSGLLLAKSSSKLMDEAEPWEKD